MKQGLFAIVLVVACEPAKSPSDNDPLEARRVEFEAAFTASQTSPDLAHKAKVADAASAYLGQAQWSARDKEQYWTLVTVVLNRIKPQMQQLLATDVACVYRRSALDPYVAGQQPELLVLAAALAQDCVDAEQLDAASVVLKRTTAGCRFVNETAPAIWKRSTEELKKDAVLRAVERCSTRETLAQNLAFLPDDAMERYRQNKVIDAQRNLNEAVDRGRSDCKNACFDLYSDTTCSRRCDGNLECRRICSAASDRCYRNCQ